MKNSFHENGFTIRERIRRHEKGFTRKERQIAIILTAGDPTAGLKTIAELGKHAAASGATVLRFINKLGYSGYPEFQEALRNELTEFLESPLSRYHATDFKGKNGDPLGNYVHYAIRTLNKMVNTTSNVEFDKVARLLADKRHCVYVIGGRFSRSLAELLCYGLTGLRGRVHLVANDSRSMVSQLLALQKHDIVIVFDFRRYQDDINQFAKLACRAGATLVVFTDQWQAPCCKYAQSVLALPVAGPSVFDSAIAPMVCVEALIAYLAELLENRAKECIEQAEWLYRQLADTSV